MGATPENRLSIDYGHTGVTAVVKGRDGGVGVVLVDESSVTSTGVAVAVDGRVLTGRAAVEEGARRQESYVRVPARGLAGGPVPVGATQVDPIDMVAATLRHVAGQAGGTGNRWG